MAPIGSRQANVERLDGREFLQYGSGTQSGRMHLQAVLQRRHQTVRQKSYQDMRLDTMFQLMVNRPNAQVAFQSLERRFDLHQLHVAIPQHRRIFRHQIRAQQIVPVASLRFP